MVNGNTWPFQTVEQRRYRFRFLNGCQSRFLILDFNAIPGVEVWQIGNEGGFLAAPVNLTADHGNRLLMGLAERADVIVDFTNVPAGNYVLGNVGPDEPFGGGVPGVDFPSPIPARPARSCSSASCRRSRRRLHPAAVPPVAGDHAAACGDGHAAAGADRGRERGCRRGRRGARGPGRRTAWHGRRRTTGSHGVDGRGDREPRPRRDRVWEFYNTTADAHPMHVHEIAFEVIDRQDIVVDEENREVRSTRRNVPPEPWETGFKDTVIAYPGQVTRVKGQFKTPGQFVWHCHIVEHEDNEMMRPYRIGPPQPGQPK